MDKLQKASVHGPKRSQNQTEDGGDDATDIAEDDQPMGDKQQPHRHTSGAAPETIQDGDDPVTADLLSIPDRPMLGWLNEARTGAARPEHALTHAGVVDEAAVVR